MATTVSRQAESGKSSMQSVSHLVYDPHHTSATSQDKHKHAVPGKRKLSESNSHGNPGRTHGRRSSDSSAGALAYKRSELVSAAVVKRSESCSSPSSRPSESKAVVRRSPIATKAGMLPVMDTSEKLENRHSSIQRVSRLHECGIRFPKLEECAHFHYDFVELGDIKVLICEENVDVVYRQGNRDDVEHYFIIKVTSSERCWLIRRNYENFRTLDRQLHKCIYDRKYSILPELKPTERVFENGISPLQRMLGLYLGRLSAIAGNMINCGPILSWFEMDNRGNRLIVTDESAINTPAIAAAHVVRRYQCGAADEVSLEVGDIVSVIDMPPSEDTIWWRGKRGFEVGYFPSECVEVIGDKVPQSMESRIPPLKPVLRKRGKLISFLRTFFSTRPTRNTLKRSGIVKERVFGCDLGEHLLNSGHDVPLVLKTCAEVIETHGIVDGIYRLSGVASNIHRLRNEFDEDKIPDLTSESSLQDVHSVSSLVKMYFRELPNPLLTYQLYDKFAAAVQEDEENRLMRIHDVIQQLPPPHYRTTEYLICHLSRVAAHGKETGMHCKNLAIVWAPNLLRSKELETACSAAALQGVGIQAVVTEFLIKYADLIFSDKLPTFFSMTETGTPRKSRPKSLAISTPTKLLSLEEARERAMNSASTSQKSQKYIEVGGGPSNLPSTYHTVIDLPHKKKGRKTGKSPAVGWKSFFSRNRESNAKVKAKVAELRLSKTEKALTEDDVANRRRLRTAKSADSLLSSTRTSMVGNRLSNASDSTTVVNPYTDKEGHARDQRLSPDSLTVQASVYGNNVRRGSLHSDSDFEMEDLSPLDENFFMLDSLIVDGNNADVTDAGTKKQQQIDVNQTSQQRTLAWTTKRCNIQRSQSADVALRTFSRSRSFQGGELPTQLKSVQLGRSPSWGPGRHDNRRSGLHLQKTQFDLKSYHPKRSKTEKDSSPRRKSSSNSSSPVKSLSPSESPRRKHSSHYQRLASSYSPTHMKSALGVTVPDRQAMSLSPTHLKAILNSPTYDDSIPTSYSPSVERSSSAQWSHDSIGRSQTESEIGKEEGETLHMSGEMIDESVSGFRHRLDNDITCCVDDSTVETDYRHRRRVYEVKETDEDERFGDMLPLRLSSSPGATRKLVSRLSVDYDDFSDEEMDNVDENKRRDESCERYDGYDHQTVAEGFDVNKYVQKLSPRWTPEGNSAFQTIWEDRRFDAETDSMRQRFDDLAIIADVQEKQAAGDNFPRSISVPSDIQRSVDNLEMIGSQSDFYTTYPVSEASKSLDSLLCERLAAVSQDEISSDNAHQVSLSLEYQLAKHQDHEETRDEISSPHQSFPPNGLSGDRENNGVETGDHSACGRMYYSSDDDINSDSDNASRSAHLGSQYSVSTQSSCMGSDVSEACHTWPPHENYNEDLDDYYNNIQAAREFQKQSPEGSMEGDSDAENYRMLNERDEDESVDLSRSDLMAIEDGDYFGLNAADQQREFCDDVEQDHVEMNDLNQPDSQKLARHLSQEEQVYLEEDNGERDDICGNCENEDEEEGYSDDSIDLPRDQTWCTQTDDVTYSQTNDIMAPVTGDIVDLPEDFPHGGYIPHREFYSQYQDTDSDSDNENVESELPSGGHMVNSDDFSTGGYLPHRDFSDSWTGEEEGDLFRNTVNPLFFSDDSYMHDGMSVDRYDNKAVTHDDHHSQHHEDACEVLPSHGQYENLQAETGRIVIRKATTQTAQKVAVVQPSRQVAMTAIPPGGVAKQYAVQPPKPSVLRHQQYRRPSSDASDQGKASRSAWSCPPGAPPQIVSSPVEESSSDSSEPEDMSGSVGMVDTKPSWTTQQTEHIPRNWPLNLDNECIHQRPQNEDSNKYTFSMPYYRDVDGRRDVTAETLHECESEDKIVSANQRPDNKFSLSDPAPYEISSTISTGSSHPGKQSPQKHAHKSEIFSSYKEPEQLAESSHYSQDQEETAANARVTSPERNSSKVDVPEAMNKPSPSRAQRKASIKELLSRFEDQQPEQRTSLDKRSQSQSSDSEVKVRPQVFQKPRILRLHSLSPTATEPPSVFGSLDSIGSSLPPRQSDKSSHSSKESLTSDLKRSSEAGSFSSRESLDSDQTKTAGVKIDGKTVGVSQLKSRFESGSGSTSKAPPVKPRVTKRRGQAEEGRPSHLDLVSSWESKLSEKSPSSEREVFSDTSESGSRSSKIDSRESIHSPGIEVRNDVPYLHSQMGGRYRRRAPREDDRSPTWTSIV